MFLDPELADADGLVGIDDDLSPGHVLRAYRQGIFPFPDEDSPILWWSPDPRAIIELDSLHISRRLARTIRTGKFSVTVNQDFHSVITNCAYRPDTGVWITPEMQAAYLQLYRLGFAHSVEVWCGDQLAGGLYGVGVGGLFAGESMFTRIRDGSKVALVYLVERLQHQGFQLFDVQYITEHTARMGAIEIPRRQYLARLRKALRCNVHFV